MAVIDRFRAKFQVTPEGCWQWTAYKNADGYGMFSAHHGRPERAHRVAYRLFVGPIPPGLELDHLCRNRACVNPAHLEPVEKRENIMRGVGRGAKNATKTHCRNGHEYTPENTYTTSRGWRACRTCTLERQRRAYAERVAA